MKRLPLLGEAESRRRLYSGSTHGWDKPFLEEDSELSITVSTSSSKQNMKTPAVLRRPLH